jgi:FKBP-type peptidyl-prolyl cis-trans isomerase SlyD
VRRAGPPDPADPFEGLAARPVRLYDVTRMKVAQGTVVTLAYDITTESGEIIESSDISGPITFLAGQARLLPGLDKRIEGMVKDQEETFEFPPEEAFGTVETAPERELPRSEFPADAQLNPGLEFEAGMPGGQSVKLRVVEAGSETVKVKMIHPLAGQKIGMHVKIVGVREATKAEREGGQVISKPPPPPAKK